MGVTRKAKVKEQRFLGTLQLTTNDVPSKLKAKLTQFVACPNEPMKEVNDSVTITYNI